jgi:hypothetical protein
VLGVAHRLGDPQIMPTQKGVDELCDLSDLPRVAVLPRTRAQAASRDSRIPLEANLVAKAVGGSMAVFLAELGGSEAQKHITAMADPSVFVETCVILLDDGARRISDGSPFLDDSQLDPSDAVWVAAHRLLEKTEGAQLDISNRRPVYAPI